MPRALITGVTGQDGSYLTELLLDQGYEVHGLVRRTSAFNRSRLELLLQDPAIYERRFFLHYADLDHPTPLRRILLEVGPDEVYHLAGQSHAGLSFAIPESTCELTALGTLRWLELLRDLPHPPRFFHPASSEIFGRPAGSPQDEQTPFAPVTPYGAAKAFATHLVTIYRQTYGLFAVNGILFNHESPRRDENFLIRKICRAAAAIKLGRQSELLLGDLTAQRDWGHARDYVRAMWLALQTPKPDDYVFATGQLHSVQDILDLAFDLVKLDWRRYVKPDPRFLRPAEPGRLVGNAAKARQLLGWEPTISFTQLIAEMTQAELTALSKSG